MLEGLGELIGWILFAFVWEVIICTLLIGGLTALWQITGQAIVFVFSAGSVKHPIDRQDLPPSAPAICPLLPIYRDRSGKLWVLAEFNFLLGLIVWSVGLISLFVF
ncbi:hypothetical protein [Almyronema epifaneia]|uniref:YggT family protein n=1 Tax=Almyronema epifaneia S1 TaxID=2991925 RepID=A0ABW6IC53_9CYAN